jgi:hypothetical protein
MSNDWYIKINNAEHGPLSSERLKQLAQQGKVTPDTPVKKGRPAHGIGRMMYTGSLRHPGVSACRQ